MKPSSVLFILSRSTKQVSENKKAEKGRFLLIGGINTLIDFGTLFILTSFGLPIFASNIASTSLAFSFSFFANKKFTFKSQNSDLKRQIPLFIIVTLFGLWVLQIIVIQLLSPPLVAAGLSLTAALFVAKICAIIVTLIWNYTLYSRVVFKENA